MSPGRCALPSGMFSTRPMTPTALTLALRAASACIRPTTQAAPPMSPFMSSMPPAGLIEMPPVSKQTPLPTKATGCVALLAAVPAHDHGAARPCRALRRRRAARPCRASSSPCVEHLDLDAELAQQARRGARTPPEKHVRRLVDEIARDDDAVDDMAGRARTPSSRRRHRRPRSRRRRASRRPRRPSFWSCSDRTCRRAAACRRDERAACSRLIAAVRQFRDDGHGVARRGQLARRDAAEFEEIVALRSPPCRRRPRSGVWP